MADIRTLSSAEKDPATIANVVRQLAERVGSKLAGTTTDNAVARYDGTTGALQNSGAFIDDSGNLGIGTQTPTWPVTVANAGPIWASWATMYDVVRVAINSYPITAQFGANAVGISEAITGATEVPSSAAAANHSSGVAGYARTASTTHGAVGIYGQGSVAANGALGAWAGNFLVSNNGVQPSSGSSGFSALSMYGIEIDVNMSTLSGAATPNIPVRGIYITGDSSVQSSNPTFYGIDVESPGINQSPHVLWKRAINTVNGSASEGISVGAQATAGPANSQSINFRSLNGSSIELTGGIAQDSGGQLVFHAGPGGGYAFTDNAFTSLLSVDVNGNTLATGSNKSKSASGGIGYATGAGGTVTQATSKSTAVTLNAVTGTITLNNAALAANTAVSFVLNNTSVAATDLIATAHESGGTTGGYVVNCRALGAGQAAIDLRNVTAGSLSEAVVIRFAVIKSVNS